MNPRLLLLAPLSFFIVPLLPAQTAAEPEPGVPVTRAQPDVTLLTRPAGEDQRIYGERQSALITPEAARALAEKFRAAYGQTTSPRIVIYVNRSLADTPSGLHLAGRTEKVSETTTKGKDAAAKTTTDKSAESSYTAADAPKPTLADQQTVREVERLFGRVFRTAGAKLADPGAAVALFADEPGGRLDGEQAGKLRAALKQVADIAIEVLISSRRLTVAHLSGDSTYEVPDIQVTAIRLGDAAIVGQAAASDVLGHGAHAVRIASQFAMPDITEATAFALMEDMLTGAK